MRDMVMELVRAFLVGGAICALVQILLDRTKMKWAGAGAGVPLLGFGNTLWKGVAKAVGEEGAMGIFKGGPTAASAGIAAALVFGYLGALVFKPKMKE